MGTDNTFLDLFSDKRIKSISKIIKRVSDIFIKPIKTWKNIISKKSKSLNLFIFYTLVYSLMTYLTVFDLKLTVKLVGFNLLFIAQPFLVLLIPFLLFRTIYKLQINKDRFFRLLFVFGVQIFPLIFIPPLLARETGVYEFYIISDNAKVIPTLLSITVLPLILKISFSRKVLWILFNYFFVSVFMIFGPKFDLSYKLNQDIDNPILIKSAVDDFAKFSKDYNRSVSKSIRDLYMTFLELDSLSYDYSTQTKFSTLNQANPFYSNLNTIDYLIGKGALYFDSKYKLYEGSKVVLNKEELMSTQKEFIKNINQDIQLSDWYRRRTKFRDNRNLYNAIYNYLTKFVAMYQNDKIINGIMKKREYSAIYKTNKENEVFAIFKLDNMILKTENLLVDKYYNKTIRLTKKSRFLGNLFFIPLRIFRKKNQNEQLMNLIEMENRFNL